MRLLTAVMISAALVLGADTPAKPKRVASPKKTTAAPVAPAEPKELSSDELAKLLEKPGRIFFLDVREPQEIAALGSVKGYVNIPLGQLQSRLKEIPKDKLIVTL